jgi:hypothetical protein
LDALEDDVVVLGFFTRDATRHHELHPAADRHRMVGGAFVVAPDECHLDRAL